MTTTLNGPFDLTYDSIHAVVPPAGNAVYALGYVDRASLFRVQRVGRVNGDLRGQLRELIGAGNKFKFKATPTDKEAFELECRLYHQFNPSSNISHPERPRGSGFRCPCCLQYSR